jgi:prepilin-type N-terminal cleavage/methylation domain-containing protein
MEAVFECRKTHGNTRLTESSFMSINNLNIVLPRVRNRIGMTLIEILVVISIIAILAGMLLPVIGAVRRRGQVTATVLEIQNLKNAIEQYKHKFGDYPPDGSNRVVFQRHIRIAFPRIAPQEIANLNSLIVDSHNPAVTTLDAAEALVFFLGGFSDDPRFPFTAKGGPLTGNRSLGLFEFDPARLSIDSTTINIGTTSNPIIVSLSTDETALHNQASAERDIFPVYFPKSSDVPFVYFDSRTYMPRSIYTYNGYAVAPVQYPPAEWCAGNPHKHPVTAITGIARPYRGDEARQATAADAYPYKWVNSNTFQIIAAGLNNDFGGNLNPPNYKRYPSGFYYSEGDNSNITSFSQGTLEDDIP